EPLDQRAVADLATGVLAPAPDGTDGLERTGVEDTHLDLLEAVATGHGLGDQRGVQHPSAQPTLVVGPLAPGSSRGGKSAEERRAGAQGDQWRHVSWRNQCRGLDLIGAVDHAPLIAAPAVHI